MDDNTRQQLLKQSVKQGMSYESYLELTDSLLAQGKTTGPKANDPKMVEYTTLNRQRMQRLDKTTELNDALLKKLDGLKRRYTWLVITEPWCGDAAQNLPVLAKAAEASAAIDIRLVLRDENTELMDQYLTNGGRAIPKLIVLDAETMQELATWGPRPEPLQQKARDYKAMPEPKPTHDEFTKEVQVWYNKDKTQTLQQEILDLLSRTEPA